jgi:hypothetical protein
MDQEIAIHGASEIAEILAQRREAVKKWFKDLRELRPLFVAILLVIFGAGGLAWGMVQAGADSYHKVLDQKIQVVSDFQVQEQDLIKNNTFNISDLETKFATIQGQFTIILDTLKDIQRRMK